MFYDRAGVDQNVLGQLGSALNQNTGHQLNSVAKVCALGDPCGRMDQCGQDESCILQSSENIAAGAVIPDRTNTVRRFCDALGPKARQDVICADDGAAMRGSAPLSGPLDKADYFIAPQPLDDINNDPGVPAGRSEEHTSELQSH